MHITSGELTGSSACIWFSMSATRTDALPLALTFGITPKEDCKRVPNTRFSVNYKDCELEYTGPFIILKDSRENFRALSCHYFRYTL